MKKYFPIKKLYQFIVVFLFLIGTSQIVNISVYAALDVFTPDFIKDSTFIDNTLGVRIGTSCDFNLTGQCNFGNNYTPTGEYSGKNCLTTNNTPNRRNGRAFYCMPPGFNGKPGSGKGVMMQCEPDSSGSLLNYDQLLTYKGLENYLSTYQVNGDKRNYMQQNCTLCGPEGSGGASSCPDWTTTVVPVVSDCEISITTDTCTFGGSAGKQNCYDGEKSRTVTGGVGASGAPHIFFCSANSDRSGAGQGTTYRCNINTALTSPKQIFNEGVLPTGVKTYQLKPSAISTYGCVVGGSTVTRRNACRLTNSSSDCTFGNQTTGNTPSNCPEAGDSVILEQGGKFHYCRPGTNKVVNCDTKFNYSDVFKTEPAGTKTKYLPDFKDSSISSKCREGWADIAGSFGSTSRKTTLAADISPIGLIKTISNFLFYFAILYFVLLILSNGFAYVRAAEDPGKLKEIKASLFNTIAGFLFVLLSGGLIISLINQIGL